MVKLAVDGHFHCLYREDFVADDSQAMSRMRYAL